MSLLSEDVRALIGLEGEPVTCPEPLGEDTLRRFVQAVMESNPVHWDASAAAASRYRDVVAVPLYPAHAHRRESGSSDPFDLFSDDPDADGSFISGGWGGLPPINVPLKRVVNGGTEAEFFKLASIGDIITSRTKYLDIRERHGKTGPMVIIELQTTYTNQLGELLTVVTIKLVLR
jgi:acyl dehydratase